MDSSVRSGPACSGGQTPLQTHHGLLCFSKEEWARRWTKVHPRFHEECIKEYFDTWYHAQQSFRCRRWTLQEVHSCQIDWQFLCLHFPSENKPKNGGICVANHTSPIDVIILASDGCYAMVTIQQEHTAVTFFCGRVSVEMTLLPGNTFADICMFRCVRLDKFTAAWWGSFRDPWSRPAHMFGLNAPKSKTDIWWPKGSTTTPVFCYSIVFLHLIYKALFRLSVSAIHATFAGGLKCDSN